MTTLVKMISAAAVTTALASHPVNAGGRSLGEDGIVGPPALRTIETAIGMSAAIDEPLLRSLTPLSDSELDAVEGGRFPFRFRFNIAIVPQINICIFCQGVSQSNQAYIFRLFERP